MTREHMVWFIADQLERYHDRYGNLHDFYTVADMLLDDIEEMGMLPPAYEVELSKVPKVSLKEYRHEWENEDD